MVLDRPKRQNLNPPDATNYMECVRIQMKILKEKNLNHEFSKKSVL